MTRSCSLVGFRDWVVANPDATGCLLTVGGDTLAITAQSLSRLLIHIPCPIPCWCRSVVARRIRLYKG
jgi:hypothetical protein